MFSSRGILKTLQLWRKLYRMERSFARRSFAPDLWCKGFFSQRRELYPFDRFDKRWFLNDWEVETKLESVNDPALIPLLENKVFFHLILSKWGRAGALPNLIGMVLDGSFRSLSTHRRIEDAFQEVDAMICKPVEGSGGAGIMTIRAGDALPPHGTYLLEERIRQHAYAACIFPGSVNTIRIVTMIDPAGAFIAGAAHRFGCASSAPVDNFKRGGLACLVDLETGRLSAARTNPGVHATHVHEFHPDTGAPVLGVSVPYWNEAKALVLDLAELFPGLYHVGWDVCITPHGPCVLEGNSRLANPNLIQAHAPLLTDRRVREFLRRNGVLSARRAALLET